MSMRQKQKSVRASDGGAEISETEQTEEVSEAAKHLVTTEDITKDISDKVLW